MKTPMKACSFSTTTLQKQILFHGDFVLWFPKAKTHTKKFKK
jgi:hypothetical protein